jgi:hypothetical protein
MGSKVRVKAIKLTTVMNEKKTESTQSYDTIKLGIDAHSKWYYVALASPLSLFLVAL